METSRASRSGPDQAPGSASPSPGQGTADAPVLEVRNLTAGYGDLVAVRDLSFTLAPGEIVALFGANGAGKTTTLLATVGALPRMSGEVRWRGRATTAPVYRLARDGLVFVPEDRGLVAEMSVRDNLRLGSGSVGEATNRFPALAALLNRKAGLLSGGEQQMLTLARALASRPRALLVDELSLGLAPLVVDRLLAALRQAADTERLAVLLIEQQARRALAVSDRWYLLAKGALAGAGGAGESAELEAAYLAGMTDAVAQRPDSRRQAAPVEVGLTKGQDEYS
jgi:branched-chain amino acid transport system ATP-binding protein